MHFAIVFARSCGVPLPERKWLNHGTPDWVKSGIEIFFITVCARERGTSRLVKSDVAKALIDSVVHRHAIGGWWAHLFMIMPDHVHGLFSFLDAGAGMKREVSNWKRWTARALTLEWQQGFFDHRLRGDEGFFEKAHYVRMNPVRAGLIARPGDWNYVWSPPR